MKWHKYDKTEIDILTSDDASCDLRPFPEIIFDKQLSK